MKKKGKRYVLEQVYHKKSHKEIMRGRWRMLAIKQHWKCYYCQCEIVEARGLSNSATSDHRIPIARGGSTHFKNLVAACDTCNDLKSDMTEEEFVEINDSFKDEEEKESA